MKKLLRTCTLVFCVLTASSTVYPVLSFFSFVKSAAIGLFASVMTYNIITDEDLAQQRETYKNNMIKKSIIVGCACTILSLIYEHYKEEDMGSENYENIAKFFGLVPIGFAVGLPDQQPGLQIEVAPDQQTKIGHNRHQIPELLAPLFNVGNSCFFNAATQCLFSSPDIKEAADNLQGDKNSFKCLLSLMMKYRTRSYYHTLLFYRYFMRKYGLSDELGAQHDAAAWLLNYLNDSELETLKNMYMIRMQTCHSCTHCDKTPVKKEEETPMISIDQGCRTIQEGINTILRPYNIRDGRCDNCNVLNHYLVTTTMTTPSHIFINKKLKRKDITINYKDLSSPMEILPIIHINQHDDTIKHYELVSMIVHRGKLIASGHYTAYVLQQSNQQWYHYDDSIRTPVTKQTMNKIFKNGYIDSTENTPVVFCYQECVPRAAAAAPAAEAS